VPDLDHVPRRQLAHLSDRVIGDAYDGASGMSALHPKPKFELPRYRRWTWRTYCPVNLQATVGPGRSVRWWASIHTHMFTYRFMELLDAKGGIYSLQTRQDGLSRFTLMQLISS
jgi:hypothetical protein